MSLLSSFNITTLFSIYFYINNLPYNLQYKVQQKDLSGLEQDFIQNLFVLFV